MAVFLLALMMAGLPVAVAAQPPSPTPTPDPRGPAISFTGPSEAVVPAGLSDRAREIYRAGIRLGNNPRAFSKVGDCNSTSPLFLVPFDNPARYRLGPYGYLQPAVDYFDGSFGRNSIAARDGFSTGSVWAAIQNDPLLCGPTESPLACEFRLHKPSLMLLSLGTNGAEWQTDESFENGLRRILDYAIERGVLPILSTKADNVEGEGRFNLIVARLAREYELPLWNFWRAAKDLPTFGIMPDHRYNLSWEWPIYDDPSVPLTGWQVRNLTALQTLDAVWRGLYQLPPANATPVPTLEPGFVPTARWTPLPGLPPTFRDRLPATRPRRPAVR